MPKISYPHSRFLSTSWSTNTRTVKFIILLWTLLPTWQPHRNAKEHVRREPVDTKFKIETTKRNIRMEKNRYRRQRIRGTNSQSQFTPFMSPYGPVKMIRQGVCWFLVPIFYSLLFSLSSTSPPYTFYSLIKRVCRSVGGGVSPSAGMVCWGKWLRLYTPLQGEGRAPRVTMNTSRGVGPSRFVRPFLPFFRLMSFFVT